MKRIIIASALVLSSAVDAFTPSHVASPVSRYNSAGASPFQSSLQAIPSIDALPTLLSSTSLSPSLLVSDALSTTLHNPTTWSILAMTSIVSLLVTWENAIENIRENTPKPILPVIDSMLAEVGGLGFVGLFLSTVVTGGPLGQIVGRLSEEFLGEEELLLETFEFLHTFFFEVGILFFGIAGVVVGAVLQRVQKLSEISELALDADGDGEVTLEELAEALDVESMVVDEDGDGEITEQEMIDALRKRSGDEKSFSNLLAEYSLGDTERAGECLLIRERMMKKLDLPPTFAVEYYFAEIFGENLEEIVELSPLTWLPLIPLIALDNSVDLSRDIVSASSANAFESCGNFFSSPWVLYSTIFLQGFSLMWALFNAWKMTSIKKMLLPTLVTDKQNGVASLLPPRYLDPVLMSQFNSSPSIFEWGEKFFTGGGSVTAPPRNTHEELFGASGAKFPSVYRDSIRFHTWLNVAQITYSTTQIVFRDAAALYLGENVGNPDGTLPEMILWSIFVASAVFQLSLAPTTFLNYCFVTSVEEYVNMKMVKGAIPNEDCEFD
ncbi:hypothetical protein ACHAWO_000990 [Cyclotella atomus]|uniref:EF-hand domain-containing protein n=1 Tax=Cyclotella atomus TaxID=382360 RepID=A0ABD3QKE7_9STRA